MNGEGAVGLLSWRGLRRMGRLALLGAANGVTLAALADLGAPGWCAALVIGLFWCAVALELEPRLVARCHPAVEPLRQVVERVLAGSAQRGVAGELSLWGRWLGDVSFPPTSALLPVWVAASRYAPMDPHYVCELGGEEAERQAGWPFVITALREPPARMGLEEGAPQEGAPYHFRLAELGHPPFHEETGPQGAFAWPAGARAEEGQPFVWEIRSTDESSGEATVRCRGVFWIVSSETPLPPSPGEAKELGEEAQLAVLAHLVRLLDEGLFQDALPTLHELAVSPASRTVSALASYLLCLAHRRAHTLLSERTRGWETELAWLVAEANQHLLDSYEAQLASS